MRNAIRVHTGSPYISYVGEKIEVHEEGQAHQFLVPPMYSGKLNVGLATMAPTRGGKQK